MKRYVHILFLVCSSLIVYSQKHLKPENGANGIPGPISRSFIITWEADDSADKYEYILSDNPRCFDGCPGDTRKRKVFGTSVVEHNLQEDKWYYWITRIHYLNGDTGYWSEISSFLAITPPDQEVDEFVKIAPNPIINDNIHFMVDWEVNPDAREFNVVGYDLQGHITIDSTTFIKGGGGLEEFVLPVNNLNSGIQICIISIGENRNNPNNIVYKRILLP